MKKNKKLHEYDSNGRALARLARRVKDADLKKMGTVPFSPYIKDERDSPHFMNNLA